MEDTTGSGESTSPAQNSIACEPCRHKKRRCDRLLPFCLQCSHDPSKCHYPEQNRRGLPPGFTSKLEARLAETEAVLFRLLSQSHAPQIAASLGNVQSILPSVSAGNQSKGDRVREWESFPLRSNGDVEAWFKWKANVASRETRNQAAGERTISQNLHSRSSRSGWREESTAGVENPPLSPDFPGPESVTTTPGSATPGAGSSKAKELAHSQRNVYF